MNDVLWRLLQGKIVTKKICDLKLIILFYYRALSPTHWSSCSMEYLALAFEHGMDYCLRNKPKRSNILNRDLNTLTTSLIQMYVKM